MIRKIFPAAALVLILVLGLFLPDAVLSLFEHKNQKTVYSVSCPADEYEYKGTFENRVSAFTAYENASVNVKVIEKTAPEREKALPWNLEELLPDMGEGSMEVFEFALTPSNMNAHFAYKEYTGRFEKGNMRVVTDAETGKPILVSVTNAQKAFDGWEKTSVRNVESFSEAVGLDTYAVTNAYAKLLGYLELNDLTDGNSYGGSALTVKTDIKGERLSISVTFSEPAGILNYRLISKASE